MAKKLQLIIKNALYYANDAFFQGHIAVDDGKIVGLSLDLPETNAETVIDAKGRHVLPGMVDSHVHFRDPGNPEREDFFTGSRAAVAGGVTTICEMPITRPPVNSIEVLEHRKSLAAERCITDFAFYGAAGFENRDKLQALTDSGVCAFKTFLHPAPKGREPEFIGLTVNDDGQLFMMMREAAKTGARFIFHCENYKLIEKMEEYLHDTGCRDYSFHYKSRPKIAETESVATIIQFARATGCKVGIAHISAPEACALVRQAQADGLNITAETCFHYLCFTEKDIDAKGPYAKCNPPLRSEADVQALWDYVRNGTISYIGSDHAPFIKEEKEIGKREGIWRAYSGMPAIECFLPIMLTQVNKGKLTLEQLCRLMSENTCKLFGLYPQKACISIGSDADFCIVDMEKKYQLSIARMFSKARECNELFDQLECQGSIEHTIIRGRVVFAEGVVDDSAKGHGQYVARHKPLG